MLGCPLANVCRVVQTSLHEVMGKQNERGLMELILFRNSMEIKICLTTLLIIVTQSIYLSLPLG